MAVTKLFGAAIKRREDPRLITGRGNFTDHIRLPGTLVMAIKRSPHAHARIVRIDTSKARAMRGVIAVYTGQDLVDKLAPVPCAWLVPDSDLKLTPYRAVAVDKVRYVGDAVAVVVAEDRYVAQDAVEAIDVEYEVLPAVVDQEKAMEPGAPQLYDEIPNNLAFHWKLHSGNFDAVWNEAEVRLSRRLINHRLIPTAMEPRGALAAYNPGNGELTIWCTSQNPHVHRLLLSAVTGLPETRIRVIATDVGGGFGSKIPMYAGEMIAAAISRDLGRPIKWIETRQENYLATIHGRDHIQYVDIAARRDGTITGVRVRAYANMGAYLSTAAPGVPTWLFGLMLQGPYAIPVVHCDVYGVLTNTTPTDAYRGAGRPEATYLLERMIDILARELGMDPAEIRRKNFIPKDRFPYTTPTGLQYDSGDYEATLNRALELLDYSTLRRQQAELRQQGRYIGIGFSTYVEVCGLAPLKLQGPWASKVAFGRAQPCVSIRPGRSPSSRAQIPMVRARKRPLRNLLRTNSASPLRMSKLSTATLRWCHSGWEPTGAGARQSVALLSLLLAGR